MIIARILGAIIYVASMALGYYKFGMGGVCLAIAAWTSSWVFFNGGVEYEEEEPEHDSCEGCKHDLGGGHCKIGVESECMEGGGYEAWEE